jgi:hypothetical protein
MSHGINFEEIKVCDDLVIDGHHRYLSALMTGVDIGHVPTHKTSAIKVIGWENMELDDNDWDTPAKIVHLNELDAAYNNLEVEFVNRITSGEN